MIWDTSITLEMSLCLFGISLLPLLLVFGNHEHSDSIILSFLKLFINGNYTVFSLCACLLSCSITVLIFIFVVPYQEFVLFYS